MRYSVCNLKLYFVYETETVLTEAANLEIRMVEKEIEYFSDNSLKIVRIVNQGKK